MGSCVAQLPSSASSTLGWCSLILRMNQLLMRLPLNGEGTRTMDHVDRYRRRFRAIDNGYTHELAVKKKKDLRRMVMEDGPEEKRAAMIIVWEEEQKAGRV